MSTDKKQSDNAPRMGDQGIIDLLWNSLEPTCDFSNRRITGWGTKTKAGLIACVRRLFEDEVCESCGCKKGVTS